MQAFTWPSCDGHVTTLTYDVLVFHNVVHLSTNFDRRYADQVRNSHAFRWLIYDNRLAWFAETRQSSSQGCTTLPPTCFQKHFKMWSCKTPSFKTEWWWFHIRESVEFAQLSCVTIALHSSRGTTIVIRTLSYRKTSSVLMTNIKLIFTEYTL